MKSKRRSLPRSYIRVSLVSIVHSSGLIRQQVAAKFGLTLQQCPFTNATQTRPIWRTSQGVGSLDFVLRLHSLVVPHNSSFFSPFSTFGFCPFFLGVDIEASAFIAITLLFSALTAGEVWLHTYATVAWFTGLFVLG